MDGQSATRRCGSKSRAGEGRLLLLLLLLLMLLLLPPPLPPLPPVCENGMSITAKTTRGRALVPSDPAPSRAPN
jgi:hypothetical protein